MRLIFDIDGTICTQEEDYKNAKPIYEVIEKINRHYEDGDFIILQTARGTMTGINWIDVTTKQLAEWGVKYDELHFGKPAGDIYIDDKAVNVLNWEADIDGKPMSLEKLRDLLDKEQKELDEKKARRKANRDKASAESIFNSK